MFREPFIRQGPAFEGKASYVRTVSLSRVMEHTNRMENTQSLCHTVSVRVASWLRFGFFLREFNHAGNLDAWSRTPICWKLDRLARNPIDGGQIIWRPQRGILEHIGCIFGYEARRAV
jgi:hypothetical protein